jgi:hypothetical protein
LINPGLQVKANSFGIAGVLKAPMKQLEKPFLHQAQFENIICVSGIFSV